MQAPSAQKRGQSQLPGQTLVILPARMQHPRLEAKGNHVQHEILNERAQTEVDANTFISQIQLAQSEYLSNPRDIHPKFISELMSHQAKEQQLQHCRTEVEVQKS